MKKAARTYSFKEIMQKSGASRQTVHRLRGNTRSKRKLIPAKIVLEAENDYYFDYEKHRMVYTESALKKLLSK